MSASTVSSKSTNTSVSNTDSANTSPDDREESSSESDNDELSMDNEKLSSAMVTSQDDDAKKDDIWFQVWWILKLGPDDIKYLEAEIYQLAKSFLWHEKVFCIPTIPVEGGRGNISLHMCKSLLRNHPLAVYRMAVITEALQSANDETLKCVFKGRPDQLEWVREWLELFDLLFRRIVDAKDPTRGVENDKESRQIFREILKEKEVFNLKAPEVLSYSEIDEYVHKSREHKITHYPGDKKTVIKEWRYPGWLRKRKTEKGKLPPPSVFHRVGSKEAQRKSNWIKDLRNLEAEFREVIQAPKKFEATAKELEAAEKELEAAKKKHNPDKENKPAKEKYKAAKKDHEAARKKYEAAKEEQDPLRMKERLENIAQKRERLKETQKEEYLNKKGYYWVEEKGRREERIKKMEERKKRKEEKERNEKEKKKKKGEGAVKALEILGGRRPLY